MKIILRLINGLKTPPKYWFRIAAELTDASDKRIRCCWAEYMIYMRRIYEKRNKITGVREAANRRSAFGRGSGGRIYWCMLVVKLTVFDNGNRILLACGLSVCGCVCVDGQTKAYFDGHQLESRWRRCLTCKIDDTLSLNKKGWSNYDKTIRVRVNKTLHKIKRQSAV